MAEDIWQKYYQNTQNRPPSKLLLKALPYVAERNIALDLGAGALNDSKYLISQGFKKVIAVDKENIPSHLIDGLSANNFTFIKSEFDKFEFLTNQFNLINAQYALPFNPPATFNQVWIALKNSLVAKGIFTGQLFGVRDEWNAGGSQKTFHSKEEALNLFSDMEIIEFEEVEKDGKLADGTPKYWHLFNIIARK